MSNTHGILRAVSLALFTGVLIALGAAAHAATTACPESYVGGLAPHITNPKLGSVDEDSVGDMRQRRQIISAMVLRLYDENTVHFFGRATRHAGLPRVREW